MTGITGSSPIQQTSQIGSVQAPTRKITVGSTRANLAMSQPMQKQNHEVTPEAKKQIANLSLPKLPELPSKTNTNDPVQKGAEKTLKTSAETKALNSAIKRQNREASFDSSTLQSDFDKLELEYSQEKEVVNSDKPPTEEKAKEGPRRKETMRQNRENLRNFDRSTLTTEVGKLNMESKEEKVEAAEIAPIQEKVKTSTDLELSTHLLQNMKNSEAEVLTGSESAQERSERLQENVNTPKEVLHGYKSVTTSENLFKGLSNAYDSATNPQEKCNYLNFASSWLKSKAYPEDLSKVENDINHLIDSAKKDSNKNVSSSGQVLSIELGEAKKPDLEESKKSSKPKFNNIDEVVSKCKNDPEKVAQEFGDLLSQVQSQASVTTLYLTFSGKTDFPGSEKGKNVSTAFTNLSEGIMDNILSQKNIEKAKIKYNFYCDVAEAAEKKGDALTLNAVTTALGKSQVRRLLNEKDPELKRLGNLEEITQPLDNYKNLREVDNKASASNPIPTHIGKDFTSLKAMETKKEFKGKEVYNAGLISNVGITVGTMAKKLENIKERKPLTDLNLNKSSLNSDDAEERDIELDKKSYNLKPRAQKK